jgi:hypothetical protein
VIGVSWAAASGWLQFRLLQKLSVPRQNTNPLTAIFVYSVGTDGAHDVTSALFYSSFRHKYAARGLPDVRPNLHGAIK